MMLLASAGLFLLAMGFLVWPLFQAKQTTNSEDIQQQQNLDLYHQREQEIAASEYTDEEKQQLKLELDRELIASDTGSNLSDNGAERSSIRFAVTFVLFLLMMSGSVALYQKLGAQQDIRLTYLLNQSQQRNLTGAEQGELKQGLADITSEQPDQLDWQYIYAQISSAENDFATTAKTYESILQHLPEEAMKDRAATQIMWLQAKYYSEKAVTKEMYSIVNQALEIMPDHQQGLGLAGIFAAEQQDFLAALTYWKKLWLALPASPEATSIEKGIRQIAERYEADTGQQYDLSWMKRLQVIVNVSIADHLKAKLSGNEMVFILAKAVSREGAPKAPLAVTRILVSQLPIQVALNDGLAMAPDLIISAYPEVDVVARISLSGQPMAQAGDFEGKIRQVKVTDDNKVLQLVIDKVAK